jgi:SAM-dependent methyltransferase
MLNVGCGTRTHRAWNNLDFSHYARLAPHPRLARFLNAIGVLSAVRYRRLLSLDPEIINWDLRKGIPFPDECFDVVYHSHVLEHLDRQHAPGFLIECRRVLKPNGVIRVAVPDLEALISAYRATLPAGEENGALLEAHEAAVERLLEQMVRQEPFGAGRQHPIVEKLERAVRGDARRVGELHRWMYDRYTLRASLESAGFAEITLEDPCTSRIHAWDQFGLDANPDGSPYISGSLYAEGVNPQADFSVSAGRDRQASGTRQSPSGPGRQSGFRPSPTYRFAAHP